MRLIRICWFVLPMLLWMGVIFHFSSSAGSTGHSEPLIARIVKAISPDFAATLSADQLDRLDYGVRKCLHVTEYLVLTLLAYRAIRFWRPRRAPTGALLAGVTAIAYAASDEFHQSFVPGRSASVGDVGIDSIGVGIAVSLILVHAALGAMDAKLSVPVPAPS